MAQINKTPWITYQNSWCYEPASKENSKCDLYRTWHVEKGNSMLSVFGLKHSKSIYDLWEQVCKRGIQVLRSWRCQRHKEGGTFENREDANSHNLEIRQTNSMGHSLILVKGAKITNIWKSKWFPFYMEYPFFLKRAIKAASRSIAVSRGL